MPDATQASAVRRFGAFEINLQAGELRKSGMRLRLSGQPFRVLAVLVEHAGLRLLEGVAGDVDVFIPGHGSIGGADQIHARIDQDRAYVHTLRDAPVTSDPRVGPAATYDWVAGVHARQLQRLAQRSERNGTPG